MGNLSEVNAAVYWLILATAIWALVFLLVPLRVLPSLLLPGLLMGFAWTYLLNYSAVNWLRLYHFEGHLLVFGGVPLGLAAAWYAGIILFFFFVLSYPRLQAALIALAALVTALVYITSAYFGHLVTSHWSVLEATYLGLISHILALKLLKLFFPQRVEAPRMPPF